MHVPEYKITSHNADCNPWKDPERMADGTCFKCLYPIPVMKRAPTASKPWLFSIRAQYMFPNINYLLDHICESRYWPIYWYWLIYIWWIWNICTIFFIIYLKWHLLWFFFTIHCPQRLHLSFNSVASTYMSHK